MTNQQFDDCIFEMTCDVTGLWDEWTKKDLTETRRIQLAQLLLEFFKPLRPVTIALRNKK